MLYPTPSHLRDVLVVDPEQSDETGLYGQVRCPCGFDVFEPLYVADRVTEGGEIFMRVTRAGGFLRLAARCVWCRKEHLLLDKDFHGYNGYVLADEEGEQARRVPRPPNQAWTCRSCGATRHRIWLGIQGEDKKTTLKGAEDVLTDADWFDAFGWFTMELTCAACGLGPMAVVDYETA